MPTYLYRCPQEHEREIVHRMLYSTGVVCECGAGMRRVIQPSRINWQGNRAGQECSPAVQALIDSRPQRLDKFQKEHEAHEKRTANESQNGKIHSL